jgi:hypothetical protein
LRFVFFFARGFGCSTFFLTGGLLNAAGSLGNAISGVGIKAGAIGTLSGVVAGGVVKVSSRPSLVPFVFVATTM